MTKTGIIPRVNHYEGWYNICFLCCALDAELHARLKAAGLNPHDANVQAINAIVSVYYAEKTSKVQVQDVLNRLAAKDSVL